MYTKALTFCLVLTTIFMLVFSPVLSPIVQTHNEARAVFPADEFEKTRQEANAAAGPCGLDIACYLAELSTALFVNLGKGIMFVAVGLFNASVEASVVNMDKHISESGVSAGWGIFLSIANIALIFILMFIGIATILKVQSYGYKQLLSKLLIIALLINFSFFFATFVIDASNNLSVDIINALSGDTSIPDRFAQAVQLQTTDATGGSASSGAIFLVGIFGLLFLLVTSFIFFAAAVLLLVRLVVLAFVIMLGPLALIAMILPVTSMYATQWWRALFSNSFFAPLYLLLVLVSLKILEAAPTPTGGIGEIVGSGGQRGVGVVITFIIATGMMVASLVIAKKLGAVGAGGLIKTGQNWRKATQGFFGRNTLGVGARVLSRSRQLKQFAAKNPFMGRMLYGALDYTSSAGFGTGRGAEQAAQSRMANIEKTAKRIGSREPEEFLRRDRPDRPDLDEVVRPEDDIDTKVAKDKRYEKRLKAAEKRGGVMERRFTSELGEGLGGFYSAQEAKGALTKSQFDKQEQARKEQRYKVEAAQKAEEVARQAQKLGADINLVRLLKNIAEETRYGADNIDELVEIMSRVGASAQDSARQQKERIRSEAQEAQTMPDGDIKTLRLGELELELAELEGTESELEKAFKSATGMKRKYERDELTRSIVRGVSGEISSGSKGGGESVKVSPPPAQKDAGDE